MPKPIAIESVTLAVRDLPRVAGFYREAIGLSVVAETADAVSLGAGGRAFLHLRHRPAFRPADPADAGLFHTAFLLPSDADLGRWLRHAATLGLHLDGSADHLVSQAVYLRDPEDNGIEVYADRPRATWRWEDGQVVMANDRLDRRALMALGAAPWVGAPSGTTIGHVHLQVGEIAAAAPFYTGDLGLAVTRRWPQAMFLSAAGYHHHLAVNTWRSAGAGPRDADTAGLLDVALRVDGPAPAPLADPWGNRFTFTDGDHP